MTSMSYCMYENTLAELSQVWDSVDDWDPDDTRKYETRARKQLAEMILDMQSWAEEVLEEEDD